MADFNAENPPKAVTNPAGVTGTEYPRHVHKGYGATYEYVIVNSDAEKAEKLAEGYALLPPAPPATTGKPVPPAVRRPLDPPHPGISDAEADRLRRDEMAREARESEMDGKQAALGKQLHEERVDVEVDRARDVKDAAEAAREIRTADAKVTRDEDAKPRPTGKIAKP